MAVSTHQNTPIQPQKPQKFSQSSGSMPASKSLLPIEAVHVSSRKVTHNVSEHVFRLATPLQEVFSAGLASPSFELQLPADLDLTSGRSDVDPDLRRITVTPYQRGLQRLSSSAPSDLAATAGGFAADEHSFAFLTRQGRLTSLISLPRFTDLRVSLIKIGDSDDYTPSKDKEKTESLTPTSFNSSADERRAGALIAVAGGTGIAAFLGQTSKTSTKSTSTDAGRPTNDRPRRHSLIWSIHVDDLGLLSLLDASKWSMIKIFVTQMEENGYSENMVQRKAQSLIAPGSAASSGDEESMVMSRMEILSRRMTLQDLKTGSDPERTPVGDELLYCGGKALEWQARAWANQMKCQFITTSS